MATKTSKCLANCPVPSKTNTDHDTGMRVQSKEMTPKDFTSKKADKSTTVDFVAPQEGKKVKAFTAIES